MSSEPRNARLELELDESPQALPRVLDEFPRRGLPVRALALRSGEKSRRLRVLTRAEPEELHRLEGALRGSSGVREGPTIDRGEEPA